MTSTMGMKLDEGARVSRKKRMANEYSGSFFARRIAQAIIAARPARAMIVDGGSMKELLRVKS